MQIPDEFYSSHDTEPVDDKETRNQRKKKKKQKQQVEQPSSIEKQNESGENNQVEEERNITQSVAIRELYEVTDPRKLAAAVTHTKKRNFELKYKPESHEHQILSAMKETPSKKHSEDKIEDILSSAPPPNRRVTHVETNEGRDQKRKSPTNKNSKQVSGSTLDSNEQRVSDDSVKKEENKRDTQSPEYIITEDGKRKKKKKKKRNQNETVFSPPNSPREKRITTVNTGAIQHPPTGGTSSESNVDSRLRTGSETSFYTVYETDYESDAEKRNTVQNQPASPRVNTTKPDLSLLQSPGKRGERKTKNKSGDRVTKQSIDGGSQYSVYESDAEDSNNTSNKSNGDLSESRKKKKKKKKQLNKNGEVGNDSIQSMTSGKKSNNNPRTAQDSHPPSRSNKAKTKQPGELKVDEKEKDGSSKGNKIALPKLPKVKAAEEAVNHGIPISSIGQMAPDVTASSRATAQIISNNPKYSGATLAIKYVSPNDAPDVSDYEKKKPRKNAKRTTTVDDQSKRTTTNTVGGIYSEVSPPTSPIKQRSPMLSAVMSVKTVGSGTSTVDDKDKRATKAQLDGSNSLVPGSPIKQRGPILSDVSALTGINGGGLQDSSESLNPPAQKAKFSFLGMGKRFTKNV